ncbi:MAG: DUF4037 domain-containing protein [Kangiellaceae bacterium]|nr:DUF4037 domain-containing protein [Kangiellaceae bacterium]
MSVHFDKLINQLKKLPQVDAIALGGSRATGQNDRTSDYDVYVYLNSAVAPSERQALLEAECCYLEVDNQFWETEDDGILQDGTPIEFIYRGLDWLAQDLERVVEQGQASVGYTTCIWANLLDCKVLFDRDGRLTQLKNRYNRPYPQMLRNNIIEKNAMLLSSSMPAFFHQITKAYQREDFNSVNHRLAEFMAAYFDILFALNETPHPGEKRLETLTKLLRLVPDNFHDNLKHLWSVLFIDQSQSIKLIKQLIASMHELLQAQGYEFDDQQQALKL